MTNKLVNIYNHLTAIESMPSQEAFGWTNEGNTLETKILKPVLAGSSIPAIERYYEYMELGEALMEMAELEDDEWRIDKSVYAVACYIAEIFKDKSSYPAPHIFNHGPKSVVFNWTDEKNNLYLTISANNLSLLATSPQKIEKRIDTPLSLLTNPILYLSYIRPSNLGQSLAIIKAASEPSEFLE